MIGLTFRPNGASNGTIEWLSRDLLLLPSHPVQSQRWHEKEEYKHDAQLDEEQQDQSSEFFLVDFEEMCGPGCAGVPKQDCRPEIKQGEDEADDKGGEEKVSEEDDLIAVHAAIIYFNEARSITNR